VTVPSELTNSELRIEMLEALAVATDRTAPTVQRKIARDRYDALAAEIKRREGAAFGKRQQRLLRGF